MRRAQPKTVFNASPTLRSWTGAEAAIAADSPTTMAAQNRTTESIVRRFRRPRSVSPKRPTRQEGPADTAVSP
jgi:hypothetical protein